MQSTTDEICYPALIGFFRRSDGEEYVMWAEEGNRWHVTNGVMDTDDERRVSAYINTLKREKSIDLRAMRSLLERYQPTSPVLGMI